MAYFFDKKTFLKKDQFTLIGFTIVETAKSLIKSEY